MLDPFIRWHLIQIHFTLKGDSTEDDCKCRTASYVTSQNVLWRIWCWPNIRLGFHGKEVPLWPNLTMLLLAILNPYNWGAQPNI